MSAEDGIALGALTAVVLNWNQPDLTVRSVRCLVADGVAAERVVVVDNASTDASWERFLAELGDSTLVRVAENVGFSRGNNVGARVLPGAAYLFVNSDAFLHRAGSARALVRELNARPEVHVSVPRLLNEDLSTQPSVSPAPRPSTALVRGSGLSRLLPNDLQPHWSTHWDHGSSRDVEFAIGAVMLVRGTTWSELGGFPEESFMYAEDLAMCLEVNRRGGVIRFCSDAEFIHLGGGSTDALWSDESRAERVGRANAALIRQYLSPSDARLTLAFMRAGFAGRYAFWTLTGRRAAAAEQRALLRGYGTRSDGPVPQAREPELTVVRPGAAR